jgi:assimilatory nitrate reductase catalytic subunit
VLFLIGVDPLRDLPDGDLVRRALDNVPVKVVQGLELGSLERYADAFLPASAFLEKDGHVSTWEGRGQRLRAIRGRDGISLADWEIFASMALACGGDLGFESLDELHEEMGRLVGAREESDRDDAVGAPVADGQPSGSVEGLDAQPDWERVRGADGATAEVDRARDDLGESHSADAAGSSDGEGLVLFTYPLLVDEGRLTEGADELKAALGDDAFVEVHPHDAIQASLTDGQVAVVRTRAGQAELAVRVTEHVAAGAVFVPFNQPGPAINSLLSGQMVARATISAPAGSGGAEPREDAEPAVASAAASTGGAA